MPEKQSADGPSLETYAETRLNLFKESVDKLEASLRERIDAVEKTGKSAKRHLRDEIAHTKQMLETAQATMKVQAERAEKTQHDINVASNEWRSTLNDFRGSVATKLELDRLYAEFGAYKLENEKRMAASVGERIAKGESKEDWKGYAALIIAVLAAALAYFGKH